MADIYIGNVKGPQGETGATGAQGPQGDAATIEVGTVSTTAYGNTAQVINTGTSSEAVFDFVIPQGRPGEETTTMSSLTLDTVTAQSAEYPIPATGESGAVVFGKIIKFFNDIKTAVNSKINISDIVNNLTSTATNKPLSAAQGKALNDALGTVSSSAANAQTRMSPTASDNLKYTTRGNGFRLTKWDPSTLNIPESNTWGICAQFDLEDGTNRWYNNLAFSTVGRMYYSYKTNNGAWSAWVDITNAMQIYADANKAINAIAYESSINKFTFRDAKTNQWHQITIN